MNDEHHYHFVFQKFFSYSWPQWTHLFASPFFTSSLNNLAAWGVSQRDEVEFKWCENRNGENKNKCSCECRQIVRFLLIYREQELAGAHKLCLLLGSNSTYLSSSPAEQCSPTGIRVKTGASSAAQTWWRTGSLVKGKLHSLHEGEVC